MPVHDWTRVDDGVFHDFHLGWIAELRKALNGGLLPDGYFVMAEQVAGGGTPDVLAFRQSPRLDLPDLPDDGGTALLTAPPKTRLTARAEREIYTSRQRTLVIRHRSGNRILAVIEVVSAGNKGSADAFQTMLTKLLAALRRGIHLLVLDLHPPTPRDPNGVHGAFWGQLNGTEYERPPDADRTLAAYFAGPTKEAFIEPVAVGQTLPPMPLFLTPDVIGYVEVPLEQTYIAAFAGVPRIYRDILEAPTAS